MFGHPDPAIPQPLGLQERLAGRIANLERTVRSLSNLINGGTCAQLPVVPILPAAGRRGRIVILDVDGKIYRDTGLAWVAVG